MRRVDKEKIRVFKELGLYDQLCEYRENGVTTLLKAYEEIKTMPIYKDSSEKVRDIIDNFYGMAIDHAWGKEKRPA